MKRLIPLAVAASLALVGAVNAKTVTYVETVTRADGSLLITKTTVVLPTKAVVTQASLKKSLLRSNFR
ncbi:MAG: hypothetical protein ABJN34_02215 [Litoreibacter sp.]|uniref:hypothetical protein n=1 Tax=Litoreibacter sp. TaxID=1969459 RepID=UPI003296EA41